MENRTQKRIPDLWWLLLLEGIATIILGILFISQPAGTLKVFVIFLGVYWLIEGIFSLIRIFTHSGRAHWAWSLLSGILGIVAGILVLSQPMLSSMILTTTIVIIIAIQGILIGILDIVRGVQGDGAGAIVLGVLSAIIGIWLLVNATKAALALPILLGILTLIGGALLVYFAFRMRKFFKELLA
jgi:uncharacterized membrane protein HdeD (DUF308 family)